MYQWHSFLDWEALLMVGPSCSGHFLVGLLQWALFGVVFEDQLEITIDPKIWWHGQFWASHCLSLHCCCVNCSGSQFLFGCDSRLSSLKNEWHKGRLFVGPPSAANIWHSSRSDRVSARQVPLLNVYLLNLSPILLSHDSGQHTVLLSMLPFCET